MSAVYALAGLKGSLCPVLKSGWFRNNANEAGLRFRKQAQNGDLLLYKPTADSFHSRTAGLFYGRNRWKSLIHATQLMERGEYRQWVYSALDLIGDQSSVEELCQESLHAGHRLKSQQGILLPYEQFEFYIDRELASVYQVTVNYRCEWRRLNNIDRDCRTYHGQPERNMRRAAA